MIRFAFVCVAALAASPVLASDLVLRDVLQDQPLTDSADMKVVMSRLTVKPGGEIAAHVHPGDEHAVVVQGGTVQLTDGTEATYAAGDVIFYAAGDAHGGLRNTGDSEIVMLTTHVVNIYEPFRWLAE